MEDTKLQGKPMSTSVPTFRFHAGDDEIEQIYPEIEEEAVEKETLPQTVKADKSDSSTLSVSPPIAPPRTPKQHKGRNSPLSGIASAGEVSPVHASLSTGNLTASKRSSSMETGIVDAPAGTNTGWGLFTDIRGKIARTVEEMKNDRIARSEATKLSASHKENTSFSDSEEASSSESNQILSNNLSTSDSVSQLSGLSGTSSLSTTPTSTAPLTQRSSSSVTGKWHSKFLGDRHNDEDKSKASRPTTPVKSQEEKGSVKSHRAGSVPLVHESAPLSPHKRCTSLRSRLRPKLSELRNRRKKACANSRSYSTLSGALFSTHENESDDDDDDDVESGVEALEESWEGANTFPIPPSAPLGDVVSNLLKEENAPQDLNFKGKLWQYKFSLLLLGLLVLQATMALPSALCYVLIGVLLVLALQTESIVLFSPSPAIADMHMGNQPFVVPDYSSLPMLQVPAVKEILSTDSFQGWMNELNEPYDSKTYHISMTESVHVRLDGPCLTLSHSRTKVPKRAMWNEPPIRKVQFTDERIFDLRGWQVKLLPEGITRRRQWSKKYPICLMKCGSLEQPEVDIGNEESGLLKRKVREGKESVPACTPLTTAKYAKSSASTDSLEMLLLGTESLSNEGSMLDKSSQKKMADSESGKASDSREKKMDDAEGSGTDDEDFFCVIGSDIAPQNCIYLFARADREKEEWYRRFAEAVRETEIHSVPVSPMKSSAPIFASDSKQLTPEDAVASMAQYLRYMQHFHLEHKIYPPRSKLSTHEKDEKKEKEKDKDKEKEKDKDKDKEKEKEKDKERDKEKDKHADKDRDHEKEHMDSMVAAQEEKAIQIGCPLSWLNVIIGRICFDVLRSPVWKERIHHRLQKKLSTLKLPYFMETLNVTELDLGNTVPIFHRASQPSMDIRGIWVELDVTYQGSFRMTIESKINLMKLKRNVSEDVSLLSNAPAAAPEAPTSTNVADVISGRSPVFDSDLDDSAESSSDDDNSSVNTEDGSMRASVGNSGKKAGKKLLRMVDKIAASKYFQQATEMKYIKRAMEGVSNTRIMLSVELKGLVGTLALNLAPPPSDRLWYGFHGNPKLWLSAQPTLGDRQFNFHHISNWIEQKLCQEFQKILVLPNMDDLVIPVMDPQMPV